MNVDPEPRPVVPDAERRAAIPEPAPVEHEESVQSGAGVVRHQQADVSGRGDVQREDVYEDVSARQLLWASKISQLIWLLIAVIDAMIVFRILLRLLDANPAAGFVSFVYGFAGFFLGPFFGVVGSPAVGGAVFEVADLIGLLVYLLIGWVFVQLVWLVLYHPPTGGGSRYRRFWT